MWKWVGDNMDNKINSYRVTRAPSQFAVVFKGLNYGLYIMGSLLHWQNTGTHQKQNKYTGNKIKMVIQYMLGDYRNQGFLSKIQILAEMKDRLLHILDVHNKVLEITSTSHYRQKI